MELIRLTENLPLVDCRNWEPSRGVRGVVSDSRQVKPGDLFVACPGPERDGHRFFEEAIRRGAEVLVGETLPRSSLAEKAVFLQVRDSRQALAILLNEFYGFPSKEMRLVGITGTNGKTTVAYLIRHLLDPHLPTGYIGTLGSWTSDGGRSLSNTTPGADELFSLFTEMREKGMGAVAMEVSSHALDQRRVEGLEFELGLFTGLSPEHLDYHRTLEDYFQAKRRLFTGPLRSEYFQAKRPEKMLINGDSPHGRRLLRENRQAKSFGLTRKADYSAREIKTTFEGSEFLFEGPRGRVWFQTPLPLRFNVMNVLAAAAALDLLGWAPQDFQGALREFPGVPGRLERIEGEGFSLFVDYAHTPEAFENVLSEARRLQPKRILTLFGCGGDRDPYKRPPMARIAYHYSDAVILTSDNPRTEDPAEILRQMRQGLPSASPLPNVLEVLDRREAIMELVKMARPGDLGFILGKGHEDYQILGREKIHFDDREIVRELLKRKAYVSV